MTLAVVGFASVNPALPAILEVVHRVPMASLVAQVDLFSPILNEVHSPQLIPNSKKD